MIHGRQWISRLICMMAAAAFVSASCLASDAGSYPTPTSAFFVNDFADVIYQADQAAMQQAGEQLYNNTQAQVVVATVETLDGQEIREYGIGLSRAWKIGDSAGNDNRGVLLLFALQERQVDIEISTGLEGDITDGRTGRLLDEYAIPDFREDRFSTGLRKTYEKLIALVSTVCENGSLPEEEDNTPTARAALLVIAGVIALAVFLILIRRHRGGRGGHGGGGGMDDVATAILLGSLLGGRGRGGRGGFGGGFGCGCFSGGGGGFSGGGSSRGF